MASAFLLLADNFKPNAAWKNVFAISTINNTMPSNAEKNNEKNDTAFSSNSLASISASQTSYLFVFILFMFRFDIIKVDHVKM